MPASRLYELPFGRLAFLCLLLSTLCFAEFGYINTKASLAQVLIERSWIDGRSSPPWPWADTWPVAKLTLSGESLFVLAGANGTSLAFGPGHVDGSSMPGEPGDAMIAGHRDTHFGVLRDARPGNLIEIETRDSTLIYRVDDVSVVDVEQHPGRMLRREGVPRLLLVTCFPFDVAERGSLRLVVSAVLEREWEKAGPADRRP